MKISALSIAFCALLLATMPARAENECEKALLDAFHNDDWLDAFRNDDWEAVYQACLPLAEQGEAWMQYNLGEMYYHGKGVAKDYAQAVHWIRKAAEQDFVPAQHNLGWKYHDGEGVSKDYAQAAHWWRKAAEQGDAESQYTLGWMYYKGKGVAKDHPQAARWFRQAAEQGTAGAQFRLGRMYLLGQGVPKNYIAAYQWISLAAAQGNEKAGKFLNLLKKKDDPRPNRRSAKTSRRMASGASKRHRINPTARPARAVFYPRRRPCYTSPSANPTGEASRATAE